MNVTQEIGYFLTGAIGLYVVGNLCYWVARLVMGLSIGEWKRDPEEGTDGWFAHMILIVGFYFLALAFVVAVAVTVIGHGILKAVHA